MQTNVKRLIILLVAAVLVISLAVPAMASEPPVEVGTGGEIQVGTSAVPVIKCKWEQEPISELESGDPSHVTPGTQILPPLVWDTQIFVCYYVVVTDMDGMDDIVGVYVDVYHPLCSPPPYDANGRHKYQLRLDRLPKADGITAFETADWADLVAYNPDFDYAEVLEELNKGTAWVFYGCGLLDYEQPGGDYTVIAKAMDDSMQWSDPLENTFLYIPTCQIEIDFGSLNYGSIKVCTNKWVAGDTTWTESCAGCPKPPAGEGLDVKATVRNVGNTWTHVTVSQDDMGLGSTLTTTGEEWNVEYDARMGHDEANEVYYDPFETVTLPNYLELSTWDELDFSIHVKKWDTGCTSLGGVMTLGCEIEPFC
jgi:hypothetical protein